jgi:hypothetical protein
MNYSHQNSLHKQEESGPEKLQEVEVGEQREKLTEKEEFQ